MAKARFSGLPPLKPLAVSIPSDHVPYQMQTVKEQKHEDAEEDPVSPLSYRSNEVFSQEGQPGSEVSPLTSPTRLQPPQPAFAPLPVSEQPFPRVPERIPTQSLSQRALYNIPPRKPVAKAPVQGKEIAGSGDPRTHHSPPHASVRPSLDHSSSEAGNKSTRRSRSQSLRQQGEHGVFPIPTDFLQNHTNHSIAAPPQTTTTQVMPTPHPRSQSFPTAPSCQFIHPDRRECAHCGRSQKGNPERFRKCNRCVNLFYCADGCWAARVCHNKSLEQEQVATLPRGAAREPSRPKREPSRWEEQARPQTAPIRVHQSASTIPVRGSRREGNGHGADLKPQNLSPNRGGGSRTLWLVLAAVVCLILIIIVIVVAMKH